MQRSVVAFILAGFFSASSSARAEELRWTRIEVDNVFRSEGVDAADINKDGRLDLIHGEAWYEAPNWAMHPIRPLGDYGNGAEGYSNSFGVWAYDVNGDGWSDVICVGYPGKACHWFENPRNQPGDWKQHEIWHSACNESPQFLDITGDGKPELIIGANLPGSEKEGVMGYLEVPAGDKARSRWNFVAISEEKTPYGAHRYYHGLGAGDANLDGRADVLIRHGWWEQPKTGGKERDPWRFHVWNLDLPERGANDADCADIFVDDLDLDGDQDLLLSSAHKTGVWWFENLGRSDSKYTGHVISTVVTQTHALQYVDLNGDGRKDLVTGKRWWAHGPKADDRPDETPVVVWFEIEKSKGALPKFTPHVIGESAGTGIGIQLKVLDFNGDKRPDILVSNKKGTHVLLQQGAHLATR